MSTKSNKQANYEHFTHTKHSRLWTLHSHQAFQTMNTSLTPSIPNYEHFTHTKHSKLWTLHSHQAFQTMNTSLTPSIPDYEHFTHTKHLYKHYKYYDIIWVCV